MPTNCAVKSYPAGVAVAEASGVCITALLCSCFSSATPFCMLLILWFCHRFCLCAVTQTKHAWLQVQDSADNLKPSDIVSFVLQTDSRSKERQAARITRLKVHSSTRHSCTSCDIPAPQHWCIVTVACLHVSVSFPVHLCADLACHCICNLVLTAP